MFLLPIAVFLLVAGSIVGGYAAVMYLPGALAARRLDRRLHDVSFDAADLERCLALAARVKGDRVLGLQAPTSAAESPTPRQIGTARSG